ncbi:hypothetical protein SKAU_G00177200 [Synaphobranchus kaupii]|uniref:Uncharacterized protein n=1 Tax=Synaphobranchus kaupii TaxID=118154 RepID=A0A9Q1FLL0_SYNKA|nr:hypothetical protein SKAU_G00177200 [Synaphobranchus kaupii]
MSRIPPRNGDTLSLCGSQNRLAVSPSGQRAEPPAWPGDSVDDRRESDLVHTEVSGSEEKGRGRRARPAKSHGEVQHRRSGCQATFNAHHSSEMTPLPAAALAPWCPFVFLFQSALLWCHGVHLR